MVTSSIVEKVAEMSEDGPAAVSEEKNLANVARRALGLVDLTSLNDEDDEPKIAKLCASARTKNGKVAAVCVYSHFVRHAKAVLGKKGPDMAGVRIATVANFPKGGSDVKRAAEECSEAAELGADEVDVVFPFSALKDGDEAVGAELVAECRKACDAGEKKLCLKVIIETGELSDPVLIKKASDICLENGADFIKTSTGKTSVSATPEAAREMLNSLKERKQKEESSKQGLKISGGVKTTEQAAVYLALADEIMGSEWVSKDTFRFGASSLLEDLTTQIGDSAPPAQDEKDVEEKDTEVAATPSKDAAVDLGASDSECELAITGEKRSSSIMILSSPENDAGEAEEKAASTKKARKSSAGDDDVELGAKL